MKRWEYLVLRIEDNMAPKSPEDLQSLLNRQGDKGWEMVQGQDMDIVFKREKRALGKQDEDPWKATWESTTELPENAFGVVYDDKESER